MQQSYYSIEVSIKTPRGYVPFCNFKLSNVTENVENIFVSLAGRPVNFNSLFPFQMNLVHHDQKRLTILATQYCNLAELKENCHYISKEVFKLLNLE